MEELIITCVNWLVDVVEGMIPLIAIAIEG